MKQTFQNKYDIPISLALWLATDEYEYSDIPNTISATTLLKPLKAIILGLQFPSSKRETDIYDLLSARMGTSIHNSIEKAWLHSGDIKERLLALKYPKQLIDRIVINPQTKEEIKDKIPVYIEQRYTKALNDFNITGQLDFCFNGMLDDFKSTSVYSWIFGGKDDDYKKQGSIYKWISPTIITEDIFNIRYIFTDWSKAKARQDKNYPQQRILTKEIPLMSTQETEVFINNILQQIKKHITSPQTHLPQCTPTELWQDAPVWKYYKDRTKMARSTKNFNNGAEAQKRFVDDGSIGLIIYKPGTVKRCLYCSVMDICQQAQNYIETGLLEV